MPADIPPAGAVYAKILRAQKRGRGVRLSADEVCAFLFDDAMIMAALGGDTDDVPPWLTPTERRRREYGDGLVYDNIFEPRSRRER